MMLANDHWLESNQKRVKLDLMQDEVQGKLSYANRSMDHKFNIIVSVFALSISL